ncbi:MAG TPA: ABC transporter permease [Planctomycetota bacterium]|jgi:oligopeptide transport system permease protein|nr:ABC transporter permease [Planctomycetota bacterium]
MGAEESRSPTRLALRRFRRNRRALVSAALLGLLGLATWVVPWASPHDYRDQDFTYTLGRPNSTYWMGTDALGRDLFSRVFRGGRVSFAVALLATTVSVLVGTAYGAASAVAGGRTDAFMMRVVDVLYGLPHILLIIVIMALVESRSLAWVFLVIGLFGWLTLARIVRGQVLSLREREFVEAARALGAGMPAIIVRHMVPNVLGPVIVYATLSVPGAMLTESFLSFLGLGVSEPETSWGVLISEGAKALGTERNLWWLVTFPGAALALTLYCLNSIGDGLRDAFDVQQRPS